MVIIRGQTTVANQNGTSNFLIQHHTHLTLNPSNNIEIGDIDNIITIQLLLLVDGGGSGGTLQQSEDFFLLQVTLDVTLCTSLILGNISEHGLNAGEGSVVNAINHARNPVRITLDELGRGIHGLRLGEQSIDCVDAIGSYSMSQEGLLQTASTLSIGENLLHIGMRQNITLHHLILVKNIVLHIIILLIIIFIIIIIIISLTSAFQSLANQCINYSLLLFSQSVKDVLNGLIVGLIFDLLGIFHGFFLLHFFIIGMRQRNVLTGIDNSFFFGFLTMTDDGINECARVCTSQNEANFTNGPMNDISTVLLQLVRIDGQCRNIAMFNQPLSILTSFCIIKSTVSVHTFFSILEQCVAKNIKRFIVLVVPNQGNLLPVIIFKCIFSDGSAIRAFQIVSSSPATEIKSLHFEFFLLLPYFSNRGLPLKGLLEYYLLFS